MLRKINPMISSDVGSIPSRISGEVIWSGAKKTTSLLPLLGVINQDYEEFKNEIVRSFTDKLKAGVEIPNYPQLRDMNEMFFTMMKGITKSDNTYTAQETIKPKNGASIPETEIIKKEASYIKTMTTEDRVKVKACVTGPYTLASFFKHKTPKLYEELGSTISTILHESIFKNRNAELFHVSIDEPVLGFMNDPLLDYGSEGRDSLRKAWEKIAYTGASHGLDVSMHLHNTSENLFWDIEHLNILASHVGDPIYTQESTKKRLEETDKFLCSAVAITQYDTLIQNHYTSKSYAGNIPEKIGETWTSIRNGDIDPYLFLEDRNLLRKRLKKVLDSFGVERVAYGSPECGLNSFPEYMVAIECLRRVSDVISEF
jgi:5-methyltetrahydropteroyltriglutamate--homocysteine methyltransferase